MTAYKNMTSLVLTDGFGDEISMPIAPTMKKVTHGGKTYFRCDGIQQESEGGIAAVYLWDGYGKELIRRKKQN